MNMCLTEDRTFRLLCGPKGVHLSTYMITFCILHEQMTTFWFQAGLHYGRPSITCYIISFPYLVWWEWDLLFETINEVKYLVFDKTCSKHSLYKSRACFSQNLNYAFLYCVLKGKKYFCQSNTKLSGRTACTFQSLSSYDKVLVLCRTTLWTS